MEIELQALADTALISSPRLSMGSASNTILTSTIQAALRCLLEQIPAINAIFYLSMTSSEQSVAAFGLGFTWARIFGFGILAGLSQGLETLVSQAFGAKDYNVCTILLYRAFYVATLLMIPILPFLVFSGDIMGIFNTDKGLMDSMTTYTIWIILSVYFNGLFLSGCSYMNGQGIYIYQLYSQLIGCIVNCLLNYLLIEVFDMGIIGGCLSKTIADGVCCVALYCFVIKTKCCQQAIIKFEKQHLNNSLQFYITTIPIGGLLWLEWTCYNLFIFQSSFLNNLEQTANMILLYFMPILYAFPYGISIGATITVGNSMGESNTKKAKQFAKISIGLVSVYLLISSTITVLLGKQFSLYFTNDVEVQEILETHVIFMVGLLVTDTFQQVLSGIVRAIGCENFGCYTFMVSYFILGQPLCHLLGFVLDLQLTGIYLAMVLSIGGYDIMQVWNLLANDWDEQVKVIHNKIQSH